MIAKLWHCALCDLRHDWLATLCQIAIIVAIVSPLFVQLGLVNAYIGSLVDELVSDPQILRIRQSRSLNLTEDELHALRSRASIRFAVPSVRAIAGQVLVRAQDARKISGWRETTVLPSAPGDPLSEDGVSLAPGVRTVSLAARLAKDLDVAPGDMIRVLVTRKRDAADEETQQWLTVERILPNAADRRTTIYVHAAFIEAVERYKDGHAVPLFGVGGDRPWRPISRYASVRVYATQLETVALAAQAASDILGVEFKSRQSQIAQVTQLRATLLSLFLLLVGLAAAGLSFALIASMTAAVERKRKALAVLSLMGFPPAWLAALPVVQALMVAAMSMVLVAVAVGAGERLVEALFASMRATRTLVALGPEHWLGCIAAIVVLCVLPALVAGSRSALVAPSDALREI
ncbi:MAG: hypothetical protein GKR94_21425 [Gammaproteobacteria bacterium]|nr:hypothetical protein [Gammaproteobacteria bacterium]